MTNPATPKQQAFIATLLEERTMPEGMADLIKRNLSDPALATTAYASNTITTLLALPKKPRVTFAPAGGSPWARVYELFEGVEDSRYAIPAGMLVTLSFEAPREGYLFVEVKTYMGRRYLNRLHGGGEQGGFTRSRFTRPSDAEGILTMIKGRHVEFAGLFAREHGVCGRCGRGLTDAQSLASGIGPDCRKVWGL